MDSISIFTTALEYEKKIRDLYVEAAVKIDDERGKGIFNGLAEDEQSHVDFLNYSLEQLRANKDIDVNLLQTAIPERKLIDKNIEIPTKRRIKRN